MIRQVLAFERRVRDSCLYALLVSGLSAAAAHPWMHALLTACRHVFALLVGEPFEDERMAFLKIRLVANDSYRDRLLAPEIAQLVDLSDALQLSIPQRKAFFRCFLHLDFMRRAGVSRSELLRYCSLRDTPAARFLLPSDGAFAVAASTHRSDVFRTQRWDILQLLALMFSLCTMETATLVDICVHEIAARAEEDDRTKGVEIKDKEPEVKLRDQLAKAIEECLAFSYGVPSPVEASLAVFLCQLYRFRDLQHGKVDFVGIHGIESLFDVITLFPVLLFPCVWLQRVVKRRAMGDVTWQKLALRRGEMRLATGERDGGFLSPPDIIAASNAHQSLRRRVAQEGREPVSIGPGSQGRLSTPRKVLPVEERKSRPETPRPHCPFVTYQSAGDAWLATADSVLATVYVRRQYEVASENGLGLTTQDAAALFTQTRHQIQSRTLGKADVAAIQRQLIQEYGYQFTTCIFAKSSIQPASGDLVGSANVKKDLRRATQRYCKADEGLQLVEDNAMYWKEYTDPVVKCVFYHNIRTGESRWAAPSTVQAKRRKKRTRSPTRTPTTATPEFL